MKLLVADIGGTNARFAYQEKDDGELINFLGDRIACDGFWRELEHHEQMIKDKPENRRILDAKFFNPQNWLLFEQVSVSYPPKNVRHFVS